MCPLPVGSQRSESFARARTRARARGGSESAAWELAIADGCDRARCAAFLDGLDVLSRADWLDIGRAVLHGDAAPARAAASETLDRVLAARGLRVTAWLVSDRVETAAHVAASGGTARAGARRRCTPPCPSAERPLLAAARGAAACAALAHLVGPLLPRATHLALIQPFHTLVGDDGA